MFKKILCAGLFLGVGVLFAPVVHATHFAEMELSQRVKTSNIVGIATIKELDCVDPENKVLPPGKSCTAPGSPNRLRYKIVFKDVLYYSPSIFRDKKSRAPTEVEFAFTGMGHSRVPEDRYASSLGKDFIFFLHERRDGTIAPIHEAYFTTSMADLKKVKKLIAARSRSDN